MEHAIRFDEVRPWRAAAIVASGVAVLELLVLVVVGILVIGRPSSSHAAAAGNRATARTAKAKPHATILARARTRVVVLNGNGETGAAATEAQALRARGYAISAVGNAPEPATGPSLVMYRPGYAAEAKRLARDAGLRVVSALDGLKPSSLHRAQVVIMLGTS